MMCEKCLEEKLDQTHERTIINMATERHHLFSQSTLNKTLYGKLIHDKKNIQSLCCHHHHNVPVDKLTELEFCDRLGIEPRGKTAIGIWNRNGKKYRP